MATGAIGIPQYQIKAWRRQAEEYRTLADTVRGRTAQATYRQLADEADRLADRLDETATAATQSGGDLPKPRF
jgi:rubrerythrin